MALSKLALANLPLLKLLDDGPLAAKRIAEGIGRDLSNTSKTLKALCDETTLVRVGADYALPLVTRQLAQDYGIHEMPPGSRPPAPERPQGAVALEVPIELIDRDEATNPRTNFDEAELEELAASIRQHGVLQPILIRQAADPASPRRRVVAGERRWRAAQRAGLKAIPAVFRTLTDHEAFDIAVIENLQRADLNYIEEATAFARWIAGEVLEHGVNEAEAKRRLSERVSRTVRLIEQRLILLKLPKADQARVLLPDDDYNRLKLRDARYKVETIERKAKDRIANRLPDPELLILAEVMDKVDKAAVEIGVYTYGSKATPVRLGADKGLPAKAKGKLSFHKGGRGDARWFVSIQYGYSKSELVAQAPRFKGAKRPAFLYDLRKSVHGEGVAERCKAEGTYATDWLNGPFEEDPALVKAARKEAAEAARAEEERERQAAAEAQRKAKGAEVLEQVKILEDAWADDPNADFRPIVRRMLAEIGLPAPWRLEKSGLRAADGYLIEQVDSWRPLSPTQEAMHRLHAALINAAAGVSPPKRGKAPKAAAGDNPEPEAGPPLEGERTHQSDIGKACLAVPAEDEAVIA